MSRYFSKTKGNRRVNRFLELGPKFGLFAVMSPEISVAFSRNIKIEPVVCWSIAKFCSLFQLALCDMSWI